MHHGSARFQVHAALVTDALVVDVCGHDDDGGEDVGACCVCVSSACCVCVFLVRVSFVRFSCRVILCHCESQ